MPHDEAGQVNKRRKTVPVTELPSTLTSALGQLNADPIEYFEETIDVTVGATSQLTNIADKIALIPAARVGPTRRLFLDEFRMLNTTANAVTTTSNPTLDLEPSTATTKFFQVPTQRLGNAAFCDRSDRQAGANPVVAGALHANGYSANGGAPAGEGLSVALRTAVVANTQATIRMTVKGVIKPA